MTRRELLAWLDTRRPAPPAALRAHLEAQLSDSEERLPDHLAELGRAMLARVTGRPDGGRELALDLLAADAFVTYAFEAQAEADVAGLATLAERVAGARKCARCLSAGRACSPWWTRADRRRPRRRSWRARHATLGRRAS